MESLGTGDEPLMLLKHGINTANSSGHNYGQSLGGKPRIMQTTCIPGLPRCKQGKLAKTIQTTNQIVTQLSHHIQFD